MAQQQFPSSHTIPIQVFCVTCNQPSYVLRFGSSFWKPVELDRPSPFPFRWERSAASPTHAAEAALNEHFAEARKYDDLPEFAKLRQDHLRLIGRYLEMVEELPLLHNQPPPPQPRRFTNPGHGALANAIFSFVCVCDFPFKRQHKYSFLNLCINVIL